MMKPPREVLVQIALDILKEDEFVASTLYQFWYERCFLKRRVPHASRYLWLEAWSEARCQFNQEVMESRATEANEAAMRAYYGFGSCDKPQPKPFYAY